MPKFYLKQPYKHHRPELTIRATCKSDLATIYRMLLAEEKAKTEGNFLCNFAVIINAFLANEVIVAMLDDDTGYRFVGFYAAFEDEGGILQVRGSERSKGIGTHLANAGLKRLRRKGLKRLTIHCAPFSSKGFWTRMGATFTEEGPSSACGVIDLTKWRPRRR